jgi:hypothetical protein
MFTEADCFAIYRRLRADVVDSDSEIGQGFNRHPCSPDLVSALKLLIESLHADGRLEQYSARSDDRLEGLCRGLVARRFGCDLPKDTKVIFTNGGSEAIGVVLGALADLGVGIALPQPTYYGYEQSALRHNLRLAARYRADTGGRDVYSQPEALVQVHPGAVTGCFEDGPSMLAASWRISFDVVDVVFQLGSPTRHAAFETALRRKIEKLDFSSGCLILTPSKDLSLPSLRAGMIVTRNPAVIEFARRDRFERSFSVSPLIPLVCALYMGVVLLFRARAIRGEAGFAEELDALFDAYREFAVPFPLEGPILSRIVTHLTEMTSLCLEGHTTVRRFDDLFDATEIKDHVAGFSCFPRLRIPIESHEDFCDLANTIGRRTGLLLNPSILFGGTLKSWDALFPLEPRIRVNLSGPTRQLAANLESLRTALHQCGRLKP